MWTKVIAALVVVLLLLVFVAGMVWLIRYLTDQERIERDRMLRELQDTIDEAERKTRRRRPYNTRQGD
jgi:uncharacterized membrane protein (DUF106 family)